MKHNAVASMTEELANLAPLKILGDKRWQHQQQADRASYAINHTIDRQRQWKFGADGTKDLGYS
jgi:hypothetical protein